MTRAIRSRIKPGLHTLVRWISFGGFALVATIYFLSFYIYPTFQRAIPGLAPIRDSIRYADNSMPPGTFKEIPVEFGVMRSLHLEDGVLTYSNQSYQVQKLFADDTVIFEPLQPVVFGPGPFSFYPKPASHYLLPQARYMSTNQGTFPEILMPIWYFAVPFFGAICFIWHRQFRRGIVRLESTRLWKPLSYGVYPITLVVLIGLPAFLLAAITLDAVGQFFLGDNYLHLGLSTDTMGLALFLAAILGTAACAILLFHAYVKSSLKQNNHAH